LSAVPTTRPVALAVAAATVLLAGCSASGDAGSAPAPVATVSGAGGSDRDGFGPPPPPDPALGPRGTATMHGDAASSDTTPHPGPGRGPVTARYTALAAACPTILAGGDGLPQALCTTLADRVPTAHLLDPATGEPTATLAVARGSLLGGVYAYLDDRDRLVMVDGSGDLIRIAHDRDGPGGPWRLSVAERTPLAAAVEAYCGAPRCDAVTSVMPDRDGRVWFATGGGVVGVVDPPGRPAAGGPARSIPLPGERVTNSISTSAHGTAVVTDHALYVLTADPGGPPRVVWRQPYDRGPARKPGQLGWGSGATPTFFGPGDGTGYVTITDNAVPRPNLLVYRSDDGRPVCATPVLGPGPDGTENSPVGSGRSVFVAGTYGYPYPALPDDAGPSEPAEAPFTGGVTRVDVRPGGDGCDVRWTVPVRSATVPRLSLADRLLYTVLRTPGDPEGFAFAAVDPATGAVLATQPLGAGFAFDTLQQVGTITPDGVLYQGTVTGLVRVSRAP
jgi:hypothetical protein